ncbi:septal ring lytic transglycosylase RlpA family protein [Fodinibius roseus]|nr:septal ring lytic transglycosylase RlpA family protein [Fodinibius roseus]
MLLAQTEPFVLPYNRIAEVSSLLGAGKASWYGANFHGRSTASGERYDMHELTAAHPNLPFNTLLWVENIKNGRSALVRVNDRGPFSGGRIIDLSREAADKLGMTGTGVARVNLYLAKKDKHGNSPVKAADPVYTIQLGAFETGKKALAFARTIEEARVEIVQEKDKTYYGVFYGLYADRSEAFRKQQKLFDQKNFNVLIKELEV